MSRCKSSRIVMTGSACDRVLLVSSCLASRIGHRCRFGIMARRAISIGRPGECNFRRRASRRLPSFRRHSSPRCTADKGNKHHQNRAAPYQTLRLAIGKPHRTPLSFSAQAARTGEGECSCCTATPEITQLSTYIIQSLPIASLSASIPFARRQPLVRNRPPTKRPHSKQRGRCYMNNGFVPLSSLVGQRKPCQVVDATAEGYGKRVRSIQVRRLATGFDKDDRLNRDSRFCCELFLRQR